MGFVKDVSHEKKVKSFTLTESGTFDLIKTNKAILITDIIVSKDTTDKLVFRINDGTNDIPFMFTKDNREISSEDGLLFWMGGNLQVTTAGLNLITIGYHLVTGDNYEKWRLQNDI